MAYDEALAADVRALVGGETGVTEQKMFGGLAFLINGNMSVAVSGKGGLLVRLDPEVAASFVDNEQVSPMVMGGREMRGWVYVDGALDDTELKGWVTRSVAFARSLPAKPGKGG